MGLKNFQYNRILQRYDEAQIQNKHRLLEREQQIFEKISQFKIINDELISLSIAQAKNSLQTDSAEAYQTYTRQFEKLRLEKKQLLLDHGYPVDYLDPIYTCIDCKDTGYIGNQKCHCFQQEIVNVLYEQANLGSILESENFSSFRMDYYDDNTADSALGVTPLINMQKTVSQCLDFVKNFNSQYSNLLLYGNTGVGKTFLANCIAKALLDEAHTVVYLTAFELFDILEKNKFSKSMDEKSEMGDKFHYILNSDLLIIDDLGTELVNAFSASQVYLCINERHLSRKSTIISTNLSLDDISSLYSERVFSRIISDYTLLKIIGDDIRLKKAFSP